MLGNYIFVSVLGQFVGCGFSDFYLGDLQNIIGSIEDLQFRYIVYGFRVWGQRQVKGQGLLIGREQGGSLGMVYGGKFEDQCEVSVDRLMQVIFEREEVSVLEWVVYSRQEVIVGGYLVNVGQVSVGREVIEQ